tara:strand:+ start:10610 stop:23908 length:13299 start_codon:yes stop_codon:yes gene_type:complete
MHGSSTNKVRLTSVVQSQLPLFAQDNYPFLVEFLEEYYRYLENPGQTYDLLTNPDTYTKLDFVADSISTTELTEDLGTFDDTVTVTSTRGYPFENGMIKINDEIIYYKTKTITTFDQCTRGFSGITGYDNPGTTDLLKFEESTVDEHLSGALVSNLNALLLDEFFTKLKIQFAPGFENVSFADGLNQSLFIKQLKDFYSSKGTDDSFIILFKALYGTSPKIIRPRDFLFTPSIADYRKTINLVVEEIDGNPKEILNRVLYQEKDGDIDDAYGTVVGVEEIEKNGNEYFVISLDYGYNRDLNVTGTVFGEFTIHSQTQTVDNISVGASVITVDTTLGFSESGELLVLFNGDEEAGLDDQYMLITYDGVNVNQFLNATGVIRPIESGWTIGMNSYVYSYDEEGEEVRMRISGVLGELKETAKTAYSEIGDYAKVWRLGKATDDLKASKWMFNHAISNRVFELNDEGNNNYSITTYDNCLINGGDRVLVNCDVRNADGSLERIEKEFEASQGPTPDNSFRILNDREITEAFYIKRKVTKAKGTEIAANIQNTYIDLEGDVYIATNSLPNYFNADLQVNYRDVTLSGTFSSTKTFTVSNHGLYSGDSVFYDSSFSEENTLDLSGYYFAFRIDENNFKLAKSTSNLTNLIFIEATGFADFAKLLRTDNYAFQKQTEVEPQFAMRKMSNQKERTIDTETQAIESNERIGILKNGVEIVTNRSKDFCYYGEIEEVVVSSSGGGYDVINPPTLFTTDSTGINFEGELVVRGNLQKINIEDPGMDYIKFADSVVISGGNPTRIAEAAPKFTQIENKRFFRSNISEKVSLTNNTITFEKTHSFREGDELNYSNEGETSLGGVIDGNVYFAHIVSSTTLTLHNTSEEALEGINPVSITALGIGNHSLTASGLRNALSSIEIADPGEGYNNNKVIITSSGINTSNYVITKANHLFNQDDEIIYEHTGDAISGLASTITYFVTGVTKDTFSLFEKNENDDLGDVYANRNKLVEIASAPDGFHTFKAPPITVELSGTLGVSTFVTETSKIKLNPLFRGEIIKVEIKESGSKYGSADILNFEKQPRYSLLSGSGAILQPVIFEGELEDVIILSGGRDFNAAPEITLFENDADLQNAQSEVTPIVSGGKIVDVKIIQKGNSYSQTPKFFIETPGEGCELDFKIKSWNVDQVERLIKEKSITSDDSYVVPSLDRDFGMQYTHMYAPRRLRENLFSEKFEEGILKYRTDLANDDSENTIKYHSPLMGWAYDGSPIYGPYGYSSISGGSIKQLISGYERITAENRPNFPLGFFNEDNIFVGSGDLDENNGRFCITPEYPKGVYAYFMTVSSEVQATGEFSQNKLPQYPYCVGKNLKFTPILFNYSELKDTNQIEFDFEEYGCRRNTTPYNLKQWYSGYDYLLQPDTFDAHYSKITGLSKGRIDDIEILDKGDGYSVNDFVSFDNVGTGGTGAAAIVTEIEGKSVTSIALSETYLKGKAFQGINGLIIQCNQDLELNHKDLVRVIGISTENQLDIDTISSIVIPTISFILNKDIGGSTDTGPTTFIPVKTESLSKVRENDIIQIEDERMKVLNVDLSRSRLRVLREHDGTVGVAHSLETSITHVPTRFEIVLNTENGGISKQDRELYFDPSESVGIGTTAGFGITTSVTISNPGTGKSIISIPTRSILIPSHGLKTGEKIVYYSNTGDNLSISTNGVGSTTLADNTELFAFAFNRNRIGISTVKLGVGTESFRNSGQPISFVGVGTNINAEPFYFVGVGTGKHHSFKTQRSHASVEVSRTRCTVSTGETHGLLVGDRFRSIILPGGRKDYDVFYNDVTNRILIDQKTLINIDTENNQIQSDNHGYRDGDKVIVVSSTVGGLDNNRIYYTNYISRNIFSLSSSYQDSVGEETKNVNLTTTGTFRLRLVNPEIRSIKNEILRFNVGDSSLAYIDGTTLKSAFDFKVFFDSTYQREYLTDRDGNFVVTSSGRLGLDSDAYVEILVNELTPEQLFYKLIPKNDLGMTQSKKDLIIDDYNVVDSTKISFLNSNINANHVVVSAATSSFVFDTPQSAIGIVSFTAENSSLEYVTNSTNTTGPIFDILVTNAGNNYDTIVGVTTIVSEGGGEGSKIRILSESIGAEKTFKTENVGWDYPTDPTLSPTAKLPDILILDQKLSFDGIETITTGLNYNVAPDLIVRDSVTKKVIDELLLDYDLNGNVDIIKNTNDLSNDKPIIIPINNSNGYSIKNIILNTTTKIATLTFKTQFSTGTTFPFTVGNNVLVEGCASKTLGSSNRTFNSADFDYDLFQITEIDPNFGGSNANIKLDMSKSVGSAEILGEYDDISATGIVVPEIYFPTFAITVKKIPYIPGEIITGKTTGAQAEVQKYNEDSEILKIFGEQYFELNEEVVGSKSGTVAKIDDITLTDLYYKIEPSAVVVQGYEDNHSFLSSNEYKIQDSFYYQRFSYAIESTVTENIWEEEVERLNHLVGWKRFSNYQLESQDLAYSGISTSQNGGDFVSIADFSRVVNTNCVFDFDITVDETLLIGSKRFSTGMVFNSRELQDFNKSIGNRVLVIDDISDDFNSDPRGDQFSVIDTFKLTESRARKYLIFARDSRFTDQRQLYVVTAIHNDTEFFINQYGRVETVYELGSFDFAIFEDEAQLRFYPERFEINDYDLSFITHSISDFTSGIGTTTFGNVVDIELEHSIVSSGATTTIATIPTDYRSSKLLVQIEEGSGNVYELDEISLVHDGSEVTFQDYGQLTTDTLNEYSADGIGTYHAYIDGSNVKVDLIPDNPAIAAEVNALRISLASEPSGFTTEGSTKLTTAIVESNYTSIDAVDSTGGNLISSHFNGILGIDDFSSGYYIISIDDTTNNKYQLSELVTVSSSTTAHYSEYGQIFTDGEVGVVTAGVAGTVTSIYFTANNAIDCEVRVYAQHLGIRDERVSNNHIDMINADILTGNSDYQGTQNAVIRDFNLFHEGNPIFKKKFDGSNIGITSVVENTIELPQHFFVTGEEVVYSYDVLNEPIGIASTDVPGIGVTDILPSKLFIIKEDELLVRVAASATEALSLIPTPFNITTLGVGSDHYITAKNQNPKTLITIDNMIQSPIVSTATTTGAGNTFTTVQDVLTLTEQPERFFSGDFLQIDDEIVRVSIVGYGGSDNDVYVQRPVLGTLLADHVQFAKITKVIGNYNIIDNTLSFAEAPYGKTPIGSPDNPPDQRDYSGITTFSRFSGRSFMRNGQVDSTNDPYYKNYIFDGIEDQFTGIKSSFELKVGGQSVDGLSASNAIITVNDLFQSPKVDQLNVDIEGNYTLEEDSGVTNIIFDETSYDREDDIIIKGLPVGGRIVSVGSTKGFGYQSLVSAAGTATVSSAGTISAINVSNVGGGYRTGIQTNINVYIREETVEASSKVAIGTALVTRGRVTGVAVTNSEVFYAPRDISNVGYTSITGLTTVTTSTAHGLSKGNDIVLSGIAMTCDYALPLTVTNAQYDNITGIMTVTTSVGHGYSTFGKLSEVILTGLAFTCAYDGGAGILTHPRTTDPAYNGTGVISVNSATEFAVNVGVSTTVNFYTSGGTAQGIIIAPRLNNNSDSQSDPASQFVSVRRVNSDTEFEVNTGISTLGHFYARGGKVAKYLTVDFDDPLPYDNLATTYSTTSIGDTGGRFAKISVVVGEGSSVTDFDIKNVGYGYEINNVLTVSVGGTDGIPYMYHGRFADAGNLLTFNRQFLVKEAVGYATATYPSLLSNPDYDQTKCERDTGFIVDALANDLFFGGNFNSVAAGNKYWNGPLNYVTGETIETIATYDYLAGISTFVINNQILPTSYQGIAVSVTQFTDASIDYENGSSYTLDSCSDVATSISNLVGIVTTIIGDGAAYAPPVISPSAKPTLALPTTLDFDEFNFYITKTQTDQFTGWTIGDLQVVDDISPQFNGDATRFAIKFDGVRTSIKAAKGSLIDVQATLLVFINDILQVPGEAYLFPGGSTLRFSEAPKLGDVCKIIFYRGTGDVDVEFVDILETVSPGDILTIGSEDISLKQKDRSVKSVTSTDSVDTYLYGGVGISNDPFVERPVNWCRATTDLIIDGEEVSKARDIYEAAILPLTNIIYDVGTASTQIWIEGARTFFDNARENSELNWTTTVDIIDQDETEESIATASVTSGIVTQISLTNAGSGYFNIPTISIGAPKDDSGTQAEANIIIASGKVATINISVGGTGYDDNNPPPVLISPPTPKSETIFRVDFAGDFGEVIGVGTTTIGAGSSQGLIFEFAIPENSPLKDETIVGTGNTIDYSGIGTGDFFTIRDSTVGNATTVGYGVTSIEIDGVDLVEGNQFIDSVFQVHDIVPGTPIVIFSDDFVASLTRLGSYSVGLGVSTTVADGATLIIENNTQVVTVVEDYSQLGLSSFLSRQTFANFSWGRLDSISRPFPEAYDIKRDNGIIGIETSPILRRKNPLKASNYLS